MEDFKAQLCHIFNCKAYTVCLVCAKVIFGNSTRSARSENAISYEEFAISKHLLHPKHLENIKLIFMHCVPGIYCEDLDESSSSIITKFSFDVSLLLGNEKSYIYKKDENIFCLICKSVVCKASPSNNELYQIIQHAESMSHFNNIKELCWIYCLNSENEFLVFHRTVIYCSRCQKTFNCEEKFLIQTIVHHLQICEFTGKIQSTQNLDFLKGKVCGLFDDQMNAPHENSYSAVHDKKALIEVNSLDNMLINKENLSLQDEVEINIKNKYYLHNLVDLTLKDEGNVNGSKESVSLFPHYRCFTSNDSYQVESLDSNCTCNTEADFMDKCHSCKLKILGDLNPTIKHNACFLSFNKDSFTCNPCFIIISSSKTREGLLKQFVAHFEGIKHLKKTALQEAKARRTSGENYFPKVENSQSVDSNCDCLLKTEFWDKCYCCKILLLRESHYIINNNIQFVNITDKDCSCTLCHTSFILPENKGTIFSWFLTILISHFIGKVHKNKILKVFLISSKSHKERNKASSNPNGDTGGLKISGVTVMCNHKKKDKFLDKCKKCLRSLFLHLNPKCLSLLPFIGIQGNKCMCILCLENIGKQCNNINSVIKLYIRHFKGKKHKQCIQRFDNGKYTTVDCPEIKAYNKFKKMQKHKKRRKLLF